MRYIGPFKGVYKGHEGHFKGVYSDYIGSHRVLGMCQTLHISMLTKAKTVDPGMGPESWSPAYVVHTPYGPVRARRVPPTEATTLGGRTSKFVLFSRA